MVTAPELIHKALLTRAIAALSYVRDEWVVRHDVRPLAIAWSSGVLDDKGDPIRDAVLCLLPEDPVRTKEVVRQMANRTKACAMMVFTKTKDCVLAVYETPVGSVSWVYPIELHADVRVVGQPKVHKNKDWVGVFNRQEL